MVTPFSKNFDTSLLKSKGKIDELPGATKVLRHNCERRGVNGEIGSEKGGGWRWKLVVRGKGV